MYAIGNIIYGIPLMSNDEQPDISELLENMIDNRDAGVLSYYSGSGMGSPAAFGVELHRFDECCSFIQMNDLPREPTDAQKEEFQKHWDALDEDMRAEITEKFGSEPFVFILWSTS